MKQYDFEGAAIRALRSAVTTHWLSMLSVSHESGWRKSQLDPTELLNYFGSLRLKPGYALRAYEYHQAPDSWGLVVAMPAALPYPEPKLNGDGRPLTPDGAVKDVMEAIEGDGTPYSYLCASLLARELEQFATLSPESEWLNSFIIDANPWVSNNGIAHALAGHGFKREQQHWKWVGQKPSQWRPTVFLSEHSAAVVFHAFSGAGRQRIITYEDRYLRGSYTFSRHERAVADGPKGYAW